MRVDPCDGFFVSSFHPLLFDGVHAPLNVQSVRIMNSGILKDIHGIGIVKRLRASALVLYDWRLSPEQTTLTYVSSYVGLPSAWMPVRALADSC